MSEISTLTHKIQEDNYRPMKMDFDRILLESLELSGESLQRIARAILDHPESNVNIIAVLKSISASIVRAIDYLEM